MTKTIVDREGEKDLDALTARSTRVPTRPLLLHDRTPAHAIVLAGESEGALL